MNTQMLSAETSYESARGQRHYVAVGEKGRIEGLRIIETIDEEEDEVRMSLFLDDSRRVIRGPWVHGTSDVSRMLALAALVFRVNERAEALVRAVKDAL